MYKFSPLVFPGNSNSISGPRTKKKKKKSTAALIRNAKNRLKVLLFTLFSLDIFDMRVEKAAVFFDKTFNLMFLLSFSVIRWNFGIFLVLFNGGVLLLVEWT